MTSKVINHQKSAPNIDSFANECNVLCSVLGADAVATTTVDHANGSYALLFLFCVS